MRDAGAFPHRSLEVHHFLLYFFYAGVNRVRPTGNTQRLERRKRKS